MLQTLLLRCFKALLWYNMRKKYLQQVHMGIRRVMRARIANIFVCSFGGFVQSLRGGLIFS